MKRHFALAAAALLLPLSVVAADTAKKTDPTKDQMRRMQLEQRKLEQEKDQAILDKSALEGKLKDAQRKMDDTRKQAGAAAKELANLKLELAAAQTDKEALATKLADAEQQLVKAAEEKRQADAALLQLTAERKRLEAAVVSHKQSIASCTEHNAKLHSQGVALLEKYRDKGCFSAALQSEPFTGLRQVAIENAIEDQRDKFDELRLESTIKK